MTSAPIRILLVFALTGLVPSASAQPSSPTSFGQTKVIDLRPAGSDLSYRIWVAAPNGPAPAGGFPVLYLLDGSWYCDLVRESASIMMRSGDIPRAVIVGGGYQDAGEASRLRIR